jgi:hypothetical protein
MIVFAASRIFVRNSLCSREGLNPRCVSRALMIVSAAAAIAFLLSV